MKKYKQLTHEQRYQIYALRKAKKPMEEIAKIVGVNKSTISREVRRNKGKRNYRPEQAHNKALYKRHLSFKKKKFTDDVMQMVVEKLKMKWSPEQISGTLKKSLSIEISHATIYQFIANNKANGGNLHTSLRQGNKKRKKRYGTRDTRGQIINRVSIDKRPAIVGKKKRIGDWELDTIIGKNHKQAIVVAVERKSKFTLMKKVKRKSAKEVENAIIAMLFPFRKKVLTLTSDNGKEFANHEKIAKKLKANFYFAHPYCSYERGLNENTNGLIRQYLPKKTDFRSVNDEYIDTIVQQLNERPRKNLNFETPRHAFDATRGR